MTETAPPEAGDLPSPAAALQSRFTTILHTRMDGVPMVNPALDVRAVGFRPWGPHWLGVLVTPWFMNLVLAPRVAAQWHPIAERATRDFVFPAGVFEFIGAHDAELGNYMACSLFSPMHDFADAAAAQATAQAALDALFEAAHRAPVNADVDGGTPIVMATPAAATPAAATPAAAAATPPAAPPSAPRPAPELSKRAFLFGQRPGPRDGT